MIDVDYTAKPCGRLYSFAKKSVQDIKHAQYTCCRHPGHKDECALVKMVKRKVREEV